MSKEQVDWQEVEHLANKLGSLGREFTESDRRALTMVFDVAGTLLVDENRAVLADAGNGVFAGDRDAVLADARRAVFADASFTFVPGSDPKRNSKAFKVSELYEGEPAPEPKDTRAEEKLPRAEPAEE
ncbi:hypothetical protein [Streptomyces sp. NPDC050988]|uniref:hypothetical protein n=1 Tax=Streptomyces sp. NPDC050988 TaxID=3365637 RepID=UPI0037913038